MTFNRDGFADNVTWRQAQKYQQKNYNISWIAIARDDIRDMMGISVNRINNYMIVATLILSVAAGSLISVSFTPECPGFIVFAFYLCTGISLIFLMEAIMFGVKGQNSAFTNTMKLLTYQVRPENPAEYSHDYMKQAQWVERNGLSALFRIPGILPSYNTDSTKDKATSFRDVVDGIGGGRGAHSRPKPRGKGFQLGSKAPSQSDFNLEEATPLESLVMRTSHTWYLTKFAEFMRLWHPYDLYSKYSMGLGILCLGHSSAYFALGCLSVQDYFLTEYASTVVTVAFILMVGLVINSTFRSPNPCSRIAIVITISLGPGCSTIAAVVSSDVAKQVLVPLAYAFHFLLWVLVYIFAHDLHESATHFIRPGEGFWSKGEKAPKEEAHVNNHHRWKKQEEEYHQEWLRRQPEYDSVPPTRSQYLEQSPCARNSLRALSACGTCDPQKGQDLEDTEERSEAPAESKSSFIGWPTDEDEFSLHAEQTKRHIKSTAHSTILASALLWLAMLIWAITTYWFSPAELPGLFAQVAGQQPQITWPTAFHPRLLACKRGYSFVSDGYQIFQIDLEGRFANKITCPGLSGPILDLGVSCGDTCTPVALTKSLVHCQEGRYETAGDIDIFAVYGKGGFREQHLLSSQKDRRDEIISFSFSASLWQVESFKGFLPFLKELGGLHSRKLREEEGLIALDELLGVAKLSHAYHA